LAPSVNGALRYQVARSDPIGAVVINRQADRHKDRFAFWMVDPAHHLEIASLWTLPDEGRRDQGVGERSHARGVVCRVICRDVVVRLCAKDDRTRL
jgi:hypothetical protein